MSTISLLEVHKFLPAQTCMSCQKPIELIGGQRMIAQSERGTMILAEAIDSGLDNFRQCTKLFEDRELYFVAWGEESVFSDQVINRAREDFLAGKRPWFCQKCGKRQCHLCGEPTGRPLGSDYIFDDGHTLHSANLGYNPGCINLDCKNFRDWGIDA